jgi:hypothetical protein
LCHNTRNPYYSRSDKWYYLPNEFCAARPLHHYCHAVSELALLSSKRVKLIFLPFFRVIGGNTTIIGASETTTTSGAFVVWDGLTYIPPAQTETLGESTTIIGGTTLAPTGITVTPNPHPTTVPSTVDPVVNPKPVSWKSGGPPSPTSLPGCIGCGKSCESSSCSLPIRTEPSTTNPTVTI